MDKTFWRAVIDAEYHLPAGHSVAEATPELLGYLGDVDPELRDEIAYPVLATWIERGWYPAGDLRDMASQMTANLEVGLGETGTDSVFLRSFSVLVLMEVVGYDNVHPFLEPDEVRRWLELALVYLAREQDLRGWVDGRGWAHAVAHTADLLMMLARSRHLGGPDLERLLDGIAGRVLAPVDHVYLYAEDERLAYAVVHVLRRGLVGPSAVAGWLGRFVHPPGIDGWAKVFADRTQTSVRANATGFLRSLYFQLLLCEHPPTAAPEVRTHLLGSLQAMDLGFYTLP